MYYLPGICLISRFLYWGSYYLHIALAQFYQLFRLYYCFSRNRTHLESGYPKWVFQTMSGLVVISYLSALYTVCSCCLWVRECWIEEDGTSIIRFSMLHDTSSVVTIILNGIWYPVSTVPPVYLYWHKISSLHGYRTENDRIINERIQSILRRVLMLTLFSYAIAVVMVAFEYVIKAFGIHYTFSFYAFTTLSISYANFLMQDHNTSEYVAFLRFIRKYKCIWCFCCFASTVDEQHRIFSEAVEASDVVTGMADFSLDLSPSRALRITVETAPSTILAESTASPATPASSTSNTSQQIHFGQKQALHINEFVFDDENHEEIADEYDFGVYLEYWKFDKKNSVIPKYETLRKELLSNRHAPITKEQYECIERACAHILDRSEFTARDIGAANEKCGILAGTPMNIEHAIVLKVYTDFNDLQRTFKRQCRKIYVNEPFENVLETNSEIYHWCRRYVHVRCV